jgi:hypothetical protein
MAKPWDAGLFSLTFTDLPQTYISPKVYKFQLKRQPLGSMQPAFYKVEPHPANPPPSTPAARNPFENCALIPQPGRVLTKFIPEDDRLDGLPTSPAYLSALQKLIKNIVDYKLEEDPYCYERLVGSIPNPDGASLPAVPVTFYKVEHTHKDDSKMLLIVRATVTGGSPNGSIGVIT